MFAGIMKRVFFILFFAGMLGLLLLGWAMFGDHSTFQTGLANYEGLPEKASDITVFRDRNISGQFVADFRIAEPEFVAFSKERNWAVQPITNPESVFHARAFHEGRPNNKKEISDGLYYSRRAANGGGVTVAYDRKDGRAYIQSSSR
jgi:hypothetical protein